MKWTLVPDMPKTLYNASTVQVLGEISEIQNNFLYMTVHFVRDFSTINVDRYLEAIGKQKMYLRRQMIDTILSPSSCALLSSAPLFQSDISEKDFDIPMNISKDLFEDSDEAPSSAEKELVAPSSGKISKDDFAAPRCLKDLTSEDIYDQIEPEIFKNSYVTAPQKVDFGTEKIKLKNFSAKALKTLEEKKNRRINMKNTFKTTTNSNYLKHSQDDPKTLPQFTPNTLKRDYGNDLKKDASIMKTRKKNGLVYYSLLNYSHQNLGFELKMKETTSPENQETSSNSETDDSLHDFLNLWSTKNWIDKCNIPNKPAAFVYTPELLESIWTSKSLLIRPKSFFGQPSQLQPQQSAQKQPQQSGLFLTKKQVLEAQEIFRTANKLTKDEKALILRFMAGSRENPYPQLGNVATIKLSENQERVLQNDGTYLTMIVKNAFQMNYSSGEWKTIKKFMRPEE